MASWVQIYFLALFMFLSRGAALFVFLDRRARHGAVRAKHATIPRQWFQKAEAAFALTHKTTGRHLWASFQSFESRNSGK